MSHTTMPPQDINWFCHQCNREIVPIMVPHAQCPICDGDFVEQIDDATGDDPRQFVHDDPTADMSADYLELIQRLMGVPEPQSRRPRSPQSPTLTFTSGARTFSFGGPNRLSTTEAPTLTDFLRRGPAPEPGQPVNGSVLAQYMMSLLGGGGGLNELFARGFGGDMPRSGRMGDYAFNQQDLDEIMSYLMENNNPHAPVAATEEIINNLPRKVLESGSPLLNQDCAVCKEQFSVECEDPAELVVVTLPCNHSFHEPCIIPWLEKQSGTCPVCRHQLVPQPDHHPPGSQGNQQQPPAGSIPAMFQSVFGGPRPSGSRPPPRSNSSGSQSHSRNGSDSNRRHVPGGWDELD